MIVSVVDKPTASVLAGQLTRKLPQDIQGRARDTLIVLDGVISIQNLQRLPGMRAHKLTAKGRPNLWSLRINAQWRIIFDWEENSQSAHNVQIIDYH